MSSVRGAISLCVAAALAGSTLATAQTVHGVGSVGATTGASGAGSRAGATSRPTGAKLGDSPLATVPLFNDASNRCLDNDPSAECRMYWLARQRADPEIAYDGGLIVRIPTELAVILVPEFSRDLMTCVDPGGRDVQWRDVVERGRTVARVADALGKMYDLALAATTSSSPYRLVWCPTTPGAGTRPLGQSWRLRVAPND
jgi:hypothetical protein